MPRAVRTERGRSTFQQRKRDRSMNIMILINALPGAAAQGLIWGIMAIGVYITYRILDVADLTVDGSMCTGGAVFIMMMLNDRNVWISMAAAFGAGLRSDYGDLSYLYGDTRHFSRYPDPAWAVVRESENNGKGQPGDQRE